MSPEQIELLNLRVLPARLTVEQAAYYLGFQPHDIPILISRGLLRPLGSPPPNAPKYFALAELERLRTDVKWLARATAAIAAHWKNKRQGKGAGRVTESGSDRILKAVNQ